MSKTKCFLFLMIGSVIFSGSLSSIPQAYAVGNQITLEELGVLQLAAHDLFLVDRGDGINAHTATDFENGKLDLSTLFVDMTTGLPFSLSDIAIGGEPRNRENIILFSVAADIGQNYVDDILINGLTSEAAKQNALNDYHARFNAAYFSAFGESAPSPGYGCVTMTENLAFRTVHDFLPGKIRMDTALPNGVIDASDELFLTIFDPTLVPPTGLGFTPPFDDPLKNANGHTGPLTFELDQLSSDLNGDFDSEFNSINIFIPPGTMIVVDLEAADFSFGDQFNTEFGFGHFMGELADGAYDPNEDVMNEIRNLISKGYGAGCYVGGESIPIDTTSLLVSGFQTNLYMIIPAIVIAAGVSAVLFNRKTNNS